MYMVKAGREQSGFLVFYRVAFVSFLAFISIIQFVSPFMLLSVGDWQLLD